MWILGRKAGTQTQRRNKRVTWPARELRDGDLLAALRARDNLHLEGARRSIPNMRGRVVAAISWAYLFAASPFCVALNRSRGRRQEGIEPLPDDRIALARRFFESRTIENFNSPPRIADEAGRL